MSLNLNGPCLVTGSLAYDCLLHVDGRFDAQLADPKPGFSAPFVAPRMRREFGGCAGNIAYALQKLGDKPALMATAGGSDFDPYRAHLIACGIDDSHVEEVEGELTAQAFVASDDAHSQVIVFHPGAAAVACSKNAADLRPRLAIVAPGGRDGMLKAARELAEGGIPYIFDPGQNVRLFPGEELRAMEQPAACAIFNRNEHDAFCDITGGPPKPAGGAVVVTRGEDGSEVFMNGERFETKAAVFGPAADTTGCGDAYRSGLMHGMMRGWPWPKRIRFASAVAGVKALHTGGQGYELSSEFAARKCAEFFGKDWGR